MPGTLLSVMHFIAVLNTCRKEGYPVGYYHLGADPVASLLDSTSLDPQKGTWKRETAALSVIILLGTGLDCVCI